MNAPMEKVAERLQLTDEQAAQVEAIRSRFKADAEASRTEMKAMRKEMKALWKAPDGPDRPAILARFEAMHALKGQLKRMAINARLDIMELLTPEQREQAAQARRRGRRGRGAGRGDRRGPPEEGGEWMD